MQLTEDTNLPFTPEDLGLAHGHAWMFSEESRKDVFIKALHKSFPPETQRLCIVASYVFNLLYDERASRLLAYMVEQLSC